MKQKYILITYNQTCEIINTDKCSIFVKIGPLHFVQILTKDSIEPASVAKKYFNKGVEHFYIRYEDVDLLQKLIKEKLTSNDLNISYEDEINNLIGVMSSVTGIVKSIGINTSVAQLIKESVISTMSMYEKTERLESLVQVLSNQSEYFLMHGYLTGYLMSSLSREMCWDTGEFLNQVITASLMQNVSLDEEAAAKIYDINSPEYGDFDSFEQERIMNHSTHSAELIGNEQFFGDVVKYLILTHHEKPRREGFPARLDSQEVSLVQAGFIICSYLANLIIRVGIDNLNEDIIEEVESNYNDGSYKRIFPKLRSILKL